MWISIQIDLIQVKCSEGISHFLSNLICISDVGIPILIISDKDLGIFEMNIGQSPLTRVTGNSGKEIVLPDWFPKVSMRAFDRDTYAIHIRLKQRIHRVNRMSRLTRKAIETPRLPKEIGRSKRSTRSLPQTPACLVRKSNLRAQRPKKETGRSRKLMGVLT